MNGKGPPIHGRWADRNLFLPTEAMSWARAHVRPRDRRLRRVSHAGTAILASAGAPMRERRSHIWDRETNEHYVDPPWCSERIRLLR
jgi:hypothetical protein